MHGQPGAVLARLVTSAPCFDLTVGSPTSVARRLAARASSLLAGDAAS
jgi:hypothetical protein